MRSMLIFVVVQNMLKVLDLTIGIEIGKLSIRH